jgi:hypothetical protein
MHSYAHTALTIIGMIADWASVLLSHHQISFLVKCFPHVLCWNVWSKIPDINAFFLNIKSCLSDSAKEIMLSSCHFLWQSQFKFPHWVRNVFLQITWIMICGKRYWLPPNIFCPSVIGLYFLALWCVAQDLSLRVTSWSKSPWSCQACHMTGFSQQNVDRWDISKLWLLPGW